MASTGYPHSTTEPPLAELDPEGWSDGLRLRVKLLAVAMRELAEQIEGEGTFLSPAPASAAATATTTLARPRRWAAR